MAMYIAIVHYSAPPIIGGVETVMRAHTELLLSAGHKVVILAGRGNTFDKRAPLIRMPLLDSTHPDILAVGKELAQGVVSEHFVELRSAVEHELRDQLGDADVCIVHNAFTLHKNLPLTAALCNLSADRLVQMVAWCHDVAWTNPQYLPALYDGEPWNLLKRPAPGVRYVAVSRDRAGQLATLWGQDGPPMIQIPNGVDGPAFLRLGPTAQRLAERLALWHQDLVLLLPARLTRRKNIELAIRTTASLVARGIKVCLLVTGPPGPHNVTNIHYVRQLDELRRSLAVERQVILLYLERDAAGRPMRIGDRVVADLYALSDALLFPSKQEGFGIPVLEAALARMPAFYSDIEPLRELAGDDAHFFALDSSPQAIADQIEDWMRNDRIYRLRRRVIQRYTWQAVYVNHIEPLLMEIAQQAKPQLDTK